MARPLTDLAGLSVSAGDFLGAALETIAQPVWVVDPGGRIRFTDPAGAVVAFTDAGDRRPRGAVAASA